MILGIWAKVNGNNYVDITDSASQFTQVSVLCIVVGLFVMIVGVVGAVGAIFSSTIFGRITLGLVSGSYISRNKGGGGGGRGCHHALCVMALIVHIFSLPSSPPPFFLPLPIHLGLVSVISRGGRGGKVYNLQ